MLLLILNIVFCLAFAVFAYLNLNDKDAWLWVSIYMAASILCGLAAFGKHFPALNLLLIAFYLVYAVKLFFVRDGVKDWLITYRRPSLVESMQATKPYIENAREFFGLLIVSGALLMNYVAGT